MTTSPRRVTVKELHALLRTAWQKAKESRQQLERDGGRHKDIQRASNAEADALAALTRLPPRGYPMKTQPIYTVENETREITHRAETESLRAEIHAWQGIAGNLAQILVGLADDPTTNLPSSMRDAMRNAYANQCAAHGVTR